MQIIFENETQRKIHHLLDKNPGLHLSKISEVLNVKLNEVEIQLQLLKNKGIITISTEQGIKRYYLKQFKMKTREIQTQELRQKIYDLIAENPGLYLTKIAELLKMSKQLADYHLLYMERNGEIVAIKDSNEFYRRYYIRRHTVQNKDRLALEALQQELPFQIVLLLLNNTHLRHKEIYGYLNISPSKLSYYINKLKNARIVDVTSFGQEKGYRLRNRTDVLRILKKYKMHLGVYLVLEKFKNMWNDLNLF